MNPNAPQPGFELPTPQTEGGNEALSPGVEAPMPSRPEIDQGPSLPPVQVPAAQNPVPQVGANPPVPQTDNAVAAANPTIADDSDLIEKEWVQKAKQIVAETKDDPYRQNKEISRFKADYLKKRYNKDIKLEEA